MYRELSHPVPQLPLPAPASVPAPAPVLAPAPDLCGASTRAECAAVGCLTSLVALFGAHCPSPSQASHASHHSRPRARQLGVVSARYQFAHLLTRLYALRRLLQRHPTVRSVAPPTPCTMHHPTRGVDACLQGLGERRRGRTEGGPRARIGWWRRVVASRRGEAHRASAARRGSDAPRVHGHPS